MKITINKVPAPMFTEFGLVEKFKEEKLLHSKKIIVDYDLKGKSRVSTSVQVGNWRRKANIVIGNYKFHKFEEISNLTGKYTEGGYFKITKKQNFEVYVEYLKELVTHIVQNVFNATMDEIEIELRVNNKFC